MEFFRRSYNICNPNIETDRHDYLDQICEFGFLDKSTNQSPTYNNFYSTEGLNHSLYWGKDSIHKINIFPYRYSSSYVSHIVSSSTQGYSYSDQQPRIFGCASYNLTWQSRYYYTELIFIPLKNNGFFLTNRTPKYTYHSGNYYNDFNPSPPLGIDSLMQYLDGQDVVPSFLTGIAPTQSSIINNYIYFFGGGVPVNDYYTRTIDTQKGGIFDPTQVYGDTASSMVRTNINENICTLMQMPYNSYFLDNIFLMSTAPQQLKDCSFFSFGGRNFFNIIDNIVVELPNG